MHECVNQKTIGRLEERVYANRQDIDRHEKIYDAVNRNSETLVETLNELKHMNQNMEKVVGEVEYLKDNAETKQAVEAMQTKMDHSFDRAFGRIETLENKDANEALERQKELKSWLYKGFGGLIFAILTAGAMVLLSLN